MPVYFVLVIVYESQLTWLTHSPTGTLHKAAAFWRRVDTLDPNVSSLSVPKDQRLTADTFVLWRDDLDACFVPKVAS